jgi:hypothetical protein
MSEPISRNLGEQPIAELLSQHGLASKDLVASSTDQLTRKMVVRACKGRRLTKNVKAKVLAALNAASGKEYQVGDLFNY